MTADHSDPLSTTHAVILAGGTDFGRCRLTSRLPAAFWPVIDRPALVRVVDQLCQQGIRRFTVCYTGRSDNLDEVVKQCPQEVELQTLVESMPLGTAGCLKAAAARMPSDNYFLCQGNLAGVLSLASYWQNYQEHHGELTVFINMPESAYHSNRKMAAGYLCGQSVVDQIPAGGYCDIKEALVPQLVKQGRPVYALKLERSAGPFRDWPGYLRVLPVAMQGFFDKYEVPCSSASPAKCVWVSPQANVAASARLVGPVIVLDYADIADGAVVIGPAVIGKGGRIGPGTLLDSSALWDGAQVGAQAVVQRCLLDRGAKVADKADIRDQLVD